jgi:hypothetical protein
MEGCSLESVLMSRMTGYRYFDIDRCQRFRKTIEALCHSLRTPSGSHRKPRRVPPDPIRKQYVLMTVALECSSSNNFRCLPRDL